MKRQVGLWINYTKAIIVTVTGDTDETRHIRSNIEKHVRFSGGSSASPLNGTCSISGEGNQEGKFTSYLNAYYDGVISLIRHADSIWIFGPGEAKSELEKHLLQGHLNGQIVGVETVEKMTDRQIAVKVREHYQKSPTLR
jgi:hypothetical protein